MEAQKIILLLQEDQHDKAFRLLYKHFPKVKKHIRSNSGSRFEAHDIFQEALILLYKKVTKPGFDKEIDPYGYLYNSCKFLWSNELRKKKIRQKTDGSDVMDLEYKDEFDEACQKEEKLKIIEKVLQNLGQKCKQILELFYFRSLSMESIAKKVGFATVKSAKTQKYKCMERARKEALQLVDMSNDKNLQS